MQATRAWRHRVVTESLQALARRSQPGPMRLVRDLERRGEVEAVVAFWVFNGLALRGTRDALLAIAAAPGVGTLYWAGPDEPGARDLIEPVAIAPAAPANAGPEPGLLECRADYVWGKGFRDKRVLVANIDTGVDINAPILGARWRGKLANVPPQAAWHDPRLKTTVPGDNNGHGSHTMGTICGDDGQGNHVGMAPEALWIASNVIDSPVSRAQRNIWYNEAIQWTADPDGNPATVDDVPVVASNSWGVRDPNNGVPSCSPVFHAALDAAEAATVCYVFAAGNEGARGPRVPADRIASDTNTFSVGALNAGSLSIASFSSRGPSPCDNQTIKPEVSARGVDVRSWYRGAFRDLNGTSMATPHVAGGVALLREVWNEMSVDATKRLLMRTADDLGATGEDNDHGWGRINLQKAYDELVGKLRPVFAISVMGTRVQVDRGQVAHAHVVPSSYSSKAETVTLSLEVDIDGKPSGFFFVPAFPWTWPAGIHNRGQPLVLQLPIPANLDPKYVGTRVGFRGTVRDASNQVISTATYEFVIG